MAGIPTEVALSHQQLLIDISNRIDPDKKKYDNLIQKLMSLVPKSEASRVKRRLSSGGGTLKLLETLVSQGFIKIGKYKKLKLLCKEFGNDELVTVIKSGQDEIRKLMEKNGIPITGESKRDASLSGSLCSAKKRRLYYEQSPVAKSDNGTPLASPQSSVEKGTIPLSGIKQEGSFCHAQVGRLYYEQSPIAKSDSGTSPASPQSSVEKGISSLSGIKQEGYADIFNIIESGNIARLKTFRETGCRLDVRDSTGRTLLHAAAFGEQEGMFRYLVGQGLDPYAVNNVGRSVLHEACLDHRQKMVEFLCKEYTDLISIKNKYGESSLHYCCKHNDNAETFKLLVEKGLNVNSATSQGVTVLHTACYDGTFEMVTFLTETYPTLKNKNSIKGWSALHYCASGGHVKIFKFLIDQGLNVYDVNSDGQNVLHIACGNGNSEMIRYLLLKYPELKEEVSENEWSALHYSVKYGDVDIFKLLVDNGFSVTSVSKVGGNLLHLACSYGKIEMVKHLATMYPELKDSIADNGWTALHFAAANDRTDIFKFLVDQKFDLFTKTKRGITVLDIAHQRGNHAMVKHLMVSCPQLEASNKMEIAETGEEKSPEVISIPDEDFEVQMSIVEEHEPSVNYPESITVDSGDTVSEDTGSDQAHLTTNDIPEDLDEETLNLLVVSQEDITESQESECQEGLSLQANWPSAIGVLSFSMIREYMNERGRSPKETIYLLKWVCSKLERSLGACKVSYTWCGYRKDNKAEPVLVALVNEEPPQTRNTFESFEVVYRKKLVVSDEAKDVNKTEIKKGLTFTLEERTKLHDCLRKNSKKLMIKHSNLQIISASKIKSRNYGQNHAILEERTCIVLYVHIKGIIPFQEEAFPEKIDGFAVDVREGRFIPCSNPSEYHPNLKMGCQLQSAYGKYGTLGGFVRHHNGSIGCITCFHMFLSDESRANHAQGAFNRDVYQPDKNNSVHKFGEVEDCAYYTGDENNIGIDAALIKITDPQRLPQNGGFPDATNLITGFSPQRPMVFNTGKVIKNFQEIPQTCNVVKYGFKTGHTIGMLRLLGSSVAPQKFTYHNGSDDSETYTLYQQLEVFSPEGSGVQFSEGGDSGSLVFVVKDKEGEDEVELSAVGILVGRTTHNTTIVTPIWAVLERFGLPLQMLQFETKSNHSVSSAARSSVNLNESFRLGILEADVAEMKSDVIGVKSDIAGVKSDVAGVKSDVASVKTELTTMKTSIHTMQAQMDRNFRVMGTQLEEQLNKVVQFLNNRNQNKA